MQKSKLITYFIAVAITVLAGATLSIAANWSSPSGNPPTNNALTPVNVGPDEQIKIGKLRAEDFYINKIGKWASELEGGVPQNGGSFQAVTWSPLYSTYPKFWGCNQVNKETDACTCPVGSTPVIDFAAYTGVKVAGWGIFYVNYTCRY